MSDDSIVLIDDVRRGNGDVLGITFDVAREEG
jgi:hypothetical protein